MGSTQTRHHGGKSSSINNAYLATLPFAVYHETHILFDTFKRLYLKYGCITQIAASILYQYVWLPQVIGSPFEADAQVSHLVRLGLADVGATTDSDVYTFQCPRTLYGHLTSSKKLGAMVRLGETCSADINNMTAEEVVWMTCLCGCDYINNLHGCGIAKALQIVKSWRGKSHEVLFIGTLSS